MAITALPALDRTSSTFKTDVDTFFGSSIPVFVTEANALQTDVNAKQVAASAAAATATAKELLTDADATATAADRVQTGLDRASATTSAGAATTQAGIATTQAGIATTKAGEANASAIAAAASAAGISGGPVTSVNGMTGVVTGLATTGTNTFTAAQELPTGSAIASAATVNLDTAAGNRVHITGTATITAVTLTRGPRTVIFDGILTLTHHATNNNLPGAANITTAAGDRAIYESDGATVYCTSYIKASGLAVANPIATATTSGLVPTPPNNTTTFLRGDGTFAIPASGLTLVAAVAATSGTSINFTGIPSGVRRITVMFKDVSTTGTSLLMIQLGDSGGVETAGYVSGSSTSGGSVAFETTGFLCVGSMAAATLHSGSITLNLEKSSAFTWCESGIIYANGAMQLNVSGGSKSLSALLTSIRITTVVGTDTFDLGEISISYE